MKLSNRKGFTLIELLAVIVVLALVMILAVPAILTAANNAKQKSFQMYGQKLLEAATSQFESQQLLGLGSAKTFKNSELETAPYCYTIEDLGISSQGSFQGFIEVRPSTLIGDDNKNKTEYYVWLTDNTYAYVGTIAQEVQNKATVMSKKAEDITKVTDALKACS